MHSSPDDGGDAERPQPPKSILAALASDGDGVHGEISGVHAIGGGSGCGGPNVAKAAAAMAFGTAAMFAGIALAPPPLAPRPAFAAATVSSSASSSSIHEHDYCSGDIIAYQIQKVFGLPLFGKICCLLVFTVPMVAIGGMAYKMVGPDEKGGEVESWSDAMANSFYLLNNVPGADATSDATFKRAVVTQAIVFVGMFVFAIIIGIISDEIASKVDEVKTGNSKVVERDHTVVVNWNSQLVPLLKQMAVAKAERVGTFDRPVVILADLDKETMDGELAEAMEGCPPLHVVTRRGTPFDVENLIKVNAFAARRVIILHPHESFGGGGVGWGDGSLESTTAAAEEKAKSVAFRRQQREEAHKATVVLNLRAHSSHGNPDVVVQMPFRLPANQDLVAHALKITRRQDLTAGMANVDHVEMSHVQVHGSENTGKICSFSAFQPGTSKVFECLFLQSEETPEFYLTSAPQLEGMTFGEAWRMLSQATLCGLRAPDGTVRLAPHDDTIIGANAEVVLLAETPVVKISSPDESTIPRRGSEAAFMRRVKQKSRQRPLNILFAGYSRQATPVAVGLAMEMAPRGSVVTILAEDIPVDDLLALKSTKNCKVEVLSGVPTSHRDLTAARVQDMDTVVIMPRRVVDPAEADSSVLATVLQIDAICAEANGGKWSKAKSQATHEDCVKMPHIVATLNTDSARDILERLCSPDVSASNRPAPDIIMSDDIVGGALLQVAANPKLAGLFDALLETEGHEVYLRDGELYGGGLTRGEEGTEVTWGTICERARVRKELALGIMRASSELIISPAKAETFIIEAGDRLIVLATDL